jgi:polyketide synthase PksN
VNGAGFDAHQFQPSRSDPRLADCLKGLPPAIFSERLYQSIELTERYSIELAIDLLGQLNVTEHLGTWRTVDELSAVLGFQPQFKVALQWLLARLLETGCLQMRDDGATRSYRFQKTPWKPDLKYFRTLGVNIDPANAATLGLLDYAAGAYPEFATTRQSNDHNLFGPQGIPLWINYFHNDNSTYAVNNWVAAAAAVDRLNSRSTLRVLEIGAGTGSATEIFLALLTERGLVSQLEQYLITEPNAYFRRCNQRKVAAQYCDLPLQWSTVDLDEPWSAQGIGSKEFDLVYAVNVMHVSKNLLFSLKEARSVLATDGWLVLGECVRPYENQPMYPELMFQILDSFTNVETDPEFRPNPGFLTAEQWRRAFIRAGFTRTEVAPDVERIREIYPHFFTGAICGQKMASAK